MTDHAVSSLGEVFAALDDVSFDEFGRNAGRIGLLIVGKRNRRTASKRERTAGEPYEGAAGNYNEKGDDGKDYPAHGGHTFLKAMAARSIGKRRRGTPVAA